MVTSYPAYPQHMLVAFLHGTPEAEKTRFMSIDIEETAWMLRWSVWDLIPRFSALRELTIMFFWEDDVLSDVRMLRYEQLLGFVVRKFSEWSVPKITVVTRHGVVRGTLKLQV
jgi:hypothetical protein